VTVANRTENTRTPLRRVGPAAAKNPALPPRVSSNAFKALPPSATTSSDCDDAEAGQAGPGSSSPTVAAQKRQRSDSSADGSEEPTTNPAKKSKTTEVQPVSKTTATIPTFREGADVNPKKLKASDYEDVVRALILRAASEYESLVSTTDALPDTAKRFKWAQQAWKNACAVAEESYKLTDGISSIVSFYLLFVRF